MTNYGSQGKGGVQKAAAAILGIVIHLWVFSLKDICDSFDVCDLWLRIKTTASLTGCPGLLRYHTHSLCNRLSRGSEPSVPARNTEGQAEGRVNDRWKQKRARAITRQADTWTFSSRQTGRITPHAVTESEGNIRCNLTVISGCESYILYLAL